MKCSGAVRYLLPEDAQRGTAQVWLFSELAPSRHRADQFEYVMYGKVYRIEGDETSTEAATRL